MVAVDCRDGIRVRIHIIDADGEKSYCQQKVLEVVGHLCSMSTLGYIK
jgi:hypothetical protein